MLDDDYDAAGLVSSDDEPLIVQRRPLRRNAAQPLSRDNDAPAPQQGSAGPDRHRLVPAGDCASDSDVEAQHSRRNEAAAPPAAPRVPSQAAAAASRQVVDHPAFITDDRGNSEKWPELHSLGPIDQEGQHCMGYGVAHWFEERTKADQKRGRKAGNRPVTFSRCCKNNTIRLSLISYPFPEEIKALFTGEGNTFHDTPVTPALRNTFSVHAHHQQQPRVRLRDQPETRQKNQSEPADLQGAVGLQDPLSNVSSDRPGTGPQRSDCRQIQ